MLSFTRSWAAVTALSNACRPSNLRNRWWPSLLATLGWSRSCTCRPDGQPISLFRGLLFSMCADIHLLLWFIFVAGLARPRLTSFGGASSLTRRELSHLLSRLLGFVISLPHIRRSWSHYLLTFLYFFDYISGISPLLFWRSAWIDNYCFLCLLKE